MSKLTHSTVKTFVQGLTEIQDIIQYKPILLPSTVLL